MYNKPHSRLAKVPKGTYPSVGVNSIFPISLDLYRFKLTSPRGSRKVYSICAEDQLPSVIKWKKENPEEQQGPSP